jgi:hypothetical protein
MIPSFVSSPKHLSGAIAESVEEAVEDRGSYKKHHSKHERERLRKVLFLGQVPPQPHSTRGAARWSVPLCQS